VIAQGEVWWNDLHAPHLDLARDTEGRRAGKLARAKLELILSGIDVILGR
jgi:hypothetical protein